MCALLLGALVAACALGRAGAASACNGSYSYAGVAARGSAYGVAAVIAPLARPTVVRGHVAAWVGVGGVGYGPRDTDAWLQVGVSAFSSTSILYYEVKQPWRAPRYVALRSVALGEAHRLAVVEVAGRTNVWRVSVDWTPVSPDFSLGSARVRRFPEATSESWTDADGTCNRFAYSFSSVAVAGAPGGRWQALRKMTVFQDPGYAVVRRSAASFVALGAP